MALTPDDRMLLHRCLNHQPGAWNDFVDRYLGLIYHVIHHTAHLRSVVLRPEDVEDLAAEILLEIIARDYQVLRQFQGKSSLATYLTVIARRICVHKLARRAAEVQTQSLSDGQKVPEPEAKPKVGTDLDTIEEVQKLLARLPRRARQIVRLYYLEGRSYEEISTELNIPVNTIGPILSRARKKLRAESRGVSAKPRKDAKPQPKE